jgi:hypothetical protein
MMNENPKIKPANRQIQISEWFEPRELLEIKVD